MKTNKEQILASLDPLFKEAEEKGLWFYCDYQQLWLSPKELKKHHKDGIFIWGAMNWQLRDPNDLLILAEEKIRKAKDNLDDVKNRIAENQKKYIEDNTY